MNLQTWPAPTYTYGWDGITVHEITRAVATHYCVSAVDILSHRRTHKLSEPRKVTYYLARKHTMLSTTAIGRLLNRDHTNIIVGAAYIGNRLENDPGLARRIEVITTELQNSRQKSAGNALLGSRIVANILWGDR